MGRGTLFQEVARILWMVACLSILSMFVGGCKTTKQEEDVCKVGKEVIAVVDSSTTSTDFNKWLAKIDSSFAEIHYTITTYDTRVTDSDGTHPIASVAVMEQRNQTLIKEEERTQEEEKTNRIQRTDVSVVDSTESHTTKDVVRCGGSFRWGFGIGILLAAAVAFGYRYIKNKFVG